MPIFEAVRLALAQIRVQKLKSFFTLLGVMIGVMFLIAVVSIVEGMGRYMEDDFAGRLLGANTFTLRRYAWFGNHVTQAEWLEWQRRPRVFTADVAFVRSVLPPSAEVKIGAKLPLPGSGVKADAAICFGFAGLTAIVGSLS